MEIIQQVVATKTRVKTMFDPYGGFYERKKKRTEWFFKYVYKKKLVTCTACNGSGYYDNTIRGRTPKCSSCNGTGKERE